MRASLPVPKKHPMKTPKTSRKPFVLAGCISGALSLLAANSFAATLTWDSNAATVPNPFQGAGTWTTANSFWTGAASTTWSNVTNLNDTAAFGFGTSMFTGIPGTVGLGATTQQLGGLQFGTYVGNAAKYNINNGTLNFNGAATIAVNTDYVRPFAAINTTITGTGGITVNGGGILELGTGANTFTGGLNLAAGALSTDSDARLGGAGNVVNFTGNSALVLRTNAITFARNFTIAGGVTGTFDVLNGVTDTVGGAGVAISGAGSMEKAGLGAMTLVGSNTYAGETRVRQGTLTLDFSNASSPAANIINAGSLNPTAVLRLSGGTLAATGKAATVTSQTFTGLTLDPGASAMSQTLNTATSLTLNFGAITRNAGATLNVATIAAGTSYSTSSGLTNGILGGYATVNNADWVTLSGGNFAALAAYQTGTDATAWISSDNVSLAANPTVALAADSTINSLKLTGASTIAIPGANTLTVGSGGVLVTAGAATISGGSLKGAAGADLAVHQNNAASAMTISSAIVNNGAATGLTKTGAGALTLGGANLYSGNTFLNAGTLEVSSDGNLGTGATVTARAGTTLRISGGSAFASAKNFQFDFGSNSFGATANGANGVGANFTVDVTNAAGATISGAFNVTAGTFTKSGAGTLTLTNGGINQLTRLNGGLGFNVSNGGLVFNGGAGSEYRIGQAEFTIGDNSANLSTVTLQSGTLSVGSFTSIGRGNGTTGLASGLTVSGSSTFNTGNLYTGFANGLAGYNVNPFIALSGSSITNASDSIRLSESVGSNTTATLSGTAQLLANNNLEVGYGARALLKIGAGTTVNANQVGVGGSLSANVANGCGAIYNRGTLIVRGGAATTNFPLGQGVNGYGYYLHDTAVGTAVNEIGVGGAGNGANGGGNGVLEVRSGTFTTNAWLTVNRTGGSANAASSMVLLSGGTLVPTNVAGQFQVNSNNAAAVLYGLIDVGTGGRILGGNTGNINLNQVANAGNQGILTVHDGGSVQTTRIFAGNATGNATVNLNGGTLRASASANLLDTNLDSVVIYSGGATIDSNGFNTSTGANPLLAPAGLGLPAAIPVATPGAGYLGRPVVKITDATGTGASAVASFDENTGLLTGITVTSPGSNYTAPVITLVGGCATTAATTGAVVLIANAGPGGGLTKTGTGTLTLGSAASSYTGPTTISAGTLAIGSIGNAGVNSTLGASSILATSLVFDGGTLQYTGGSGGTDRNFTITAGKTATIDISTQLTTLTFSGGSAATTGALTKIGNGTLSLIGAANSHTGTTTASAGVLAASGSFPGGFAVNGTGHLTAQNLGVGTLTVPTLALGASGFVDFEFGTGNDVITIASAGGLTLGTSALNLYPEFGVTAFGTNGTYTLFDYNTSFTGTLAGAFTIANSVVGKVYSIADVPGVSPTTGLTTTIELIINDAVVAEWTNGVGDNLWTMPGNWNGGIVPNGNGAVATFGLLATPGGVLVNGPKTAGSIVFNNAASYTLNGPAAITLNNGLGVPSISIVNTGSHTIAAPILLSQSANLVPATGDTLTLTGNITGIGSSGLTVTGAGTVVLSGINGYSGATTISAGTLEIAGGASIGGSSGLTEKNGAVFRVNSGGTTTITQPVTLDLAGGTATAVSGLANGTGNFTIELTPGSFATLSGPVANAGGSLVIRGGGGLTLTNAGASVLSNVAGLSTVVQDGSLTLNGGALATYAVTAGELTIGDNTPNQVSVTLSSGTLTVGTFTSVGRGNGTTGLASSFNMTGGTLNTLNLFSGFANGVGGYNAAPAINISGGIASVTTTRIGESAGANATMAISGSSTFTGTGDFQIGFGGNAVVTIADTAVVSIPRLGLGFGNNGAGNIGAGVIRQTGGTLQQLGGFAGDWRIGGATAATDSLAYGSYEISNGIFTTNRNFQIGAFGRGVMDISGAGASVTASAGFPVVGRFAGGVGLLNISAGTFSNTNAANFLIIGEAGTGVVNVSGTGALTVAAVPGAAGNAGGTGGIRLGHAAGGVGELNLNGGTVTASGIAKTVAAGIASVYFNGGTLKANASNTTFLQGLDSATVGPGGAFINTNGNDITIDQALNKPAGNGVKTIPIIDGGSGYLSQPIVQISSPSGVGATAVATVNGAGTVTGIVITNPGTGYLTPPTVTLLGNGTAVAATLDTATIGANDMTGGVTKNGPGTLTLTGAQNYAFLTTNAGRTNLNAMLANANINNVGGILNVNADAMNSNVTVDATTVFVVSQTLASLTIDNGGVAKLGGPAESPAPPEFPAPEFATPAEDLFGGFAQSGGVEAVPEPGGAALLLGGIATLLGLRRRKAKTA